MAYAPSMRVHVLDPTRHWECVSCGAQHVTKIPGVIQPTHPCRALSGLDVPFTDVTETPIGRQQRARHRPVEREDMIAGERSVMHDAEGTAVSALATERWDGSNDVRVYAPTATGGTMEDR